MDNLKPKKWREEFSRFRGSINWRQYRSIGEMDNAIADKLYEMLDEREAYINAAVAAEREWISVENKKIPLNEFVICGLWVDDTKNDYSYFDTYYIRFDDEFEPRDKWDNYLSEWEYDDFTHWKLLPDPPEPDAIRARGGE